MNFVSKLTLFSCIAVLAGTVLSGCRSTNDPVLSDNPAPPAPSAAGNSGSAGAVSENATNDVASTSIPTAAARFQPGETVNISTSTGSEMVQGPIATAPQSYLISDDGTISLPLIGTVQAAGKTPGELQRIITKLYVPEYFVRLAVTVTAINRVYYVGGEVAHAGPEEYLGQTTVTKAIQSAGDFTMFASHSVWLTRSDGTRVRVDVDKALRDSDSDPQVFPGDQNPGAQAAFLMIQLHILSGKKAGSRVVASRFPFRIGRAPLNDLALDDDGVWDQHMVVEFRRKEGFRLAAAPEAIAAVNSKPADDALLRNGDIITLGSAKLQFWIAPARQRGLRLRENSVWALLIIVALSELILIYVTLR